MTDETTEHEHADEQAPDVADDTAAPEMDVEPDTEPEGGNAEAARWRRRLRDAESERDALADRLTGAQRQLVEQHAAGQIKPAALWASGADLPTFITEEGAVDYDAVDAAIKGARDALGIGGVPRSSPRQGVEPGTGSTTTWTDALADR